MKETTRRTHDDIRIVLQQKRRKIGAAKKTKHIIIIDQNDLIADAAYSNKM